RASKCKTHRASRAARCHARRGVDMGLLTALALASPRPHHARNTVQQAPPVSTREPDASPDDVSAAVSDRLKKLRQAPPVPLGATAWSRLARTTADGIV